MDRDGVPYIVVEKETGGMGSFVLGALVGAGLALLFAPRSGEETQEELRERARQLREVAEERVRDASRNLEDRLDTVRTGVASRVDQVKDAVESGRGAAREARTDLEHKLVKSKAAYRAGIDAARAVADTEDGDTDDA